jgi:DNA mismatch repair protein MutL
MSMIRVSDDGCGMEAGDLELCIERHATSKLADEDLLNIRTLGFRGEALPSIGAVARLSIRSKPHTAAGGMAITVDAGKKSGPLPAAMNSGTVIEVRDLFFATPARLKFMKSERAENAQINDVVKRLAMAHPHIGFSLTTGERASLRLGRAKRDDAHTGLARIGRIMGSEFTTDAMLITAEREGIKLHGFAGLPTLSRANSMLQFMFVNGRPVRDKLLAGAVRGAYHDLMPHGRYPLLALFLELPCHLVDVNVHPAKTEVRFRDPGMVRGLMAGALREALAEAGHRATVSGGNNAFSRLESAQLSTPGQRSYPMAPAALPRANNGFSDMAQAPLGDFQPSSSYSGNQATSEDNNRQYPLGAAKAQVHETYIVAQTGHSIVIVDQHAAHERIVYEKMKDGLAKGQIATQALLIPEIVELESGRIDAIVAHASELAKLGMVLETFGNGAVIVREMPALLGKCNVREIVKDLADEITATGEAFSLREKLFDVCATMACHGSVRSGRILNSEEMNALLRQMEKTPHAGQCNHGRPTYVELKLADIERLFGR